MANRILLRWCIHIVAVAALVAISDIATAQLPHTANTFRNEAGASPAKGRVADLAWLVGDWVGRGFGDVSEETWTPPQAGSMVGVFRQHKDGKPWFYEFLLLKDEGESVELRLKHFNPDGTGWEEKDKFVTFKLVRLQPNEALFQGLTFRREGDTLKIWVAMKRGETVSEAPFEFKLRKAGV
jgi:Domain of unknown function (DUF6265)